MRLLSAQTRFRIAVGVGSLVLSLCGVPNAASAESGLLDTAPDVGSQTGPEDPSVTSLVGGEGLTVAQARSQMEAQVLAGRAEMKMPDELAKTYAGRQILHDKDGLVLVGVTDPSRADAMKSHFVGFGVQRVEVQVVPLSLAEVENLIGETQGHLRASRADETGRKVDISFTTLGHITVHVATGSLNRTEADIVRTARANPKLYQVVEVDEITTAEEQACDFTDDIECDPPLRGSVRMHTPSICSVGFAVRSRSDNKPYVLTAGHCDAYGSATWATRFADGSPHNIGAFHNSRNNAQTDVGIITVTNPGAQGWAFGWPLVTVDPTGGYTANENYVINEVQNPGLDDRVCVTGGNTARTDCGSVTALYTTAGGTDGLFRVSDLCTRGGDSGSPYFSYHVAYGIHSAGGDSGCPGGYAEQAPEAEDQMNVNIITG